MSNFVLEMVGITKHFPGVVALKDVSLRVRRGEIHAICGENGAGKSTLMKILSGVYAHGSYEGEIRFDGSEQRFGSIRDSVALGIAIIHQELALTPLMSIAENIFLGCELASCGIIDEAETHRRTARLLSKVGLDESPEEKITNLGVGKQQLVEIAKALAKECKVLILDEPTASLNENDSQALLGLLLEFRAQGMTMLLISHKLNEIMRVADSVTVLRDGVTVATMDCRDGRVNEDLIIRHMVGREMADRYPQRFPQIGETVFEVKNWTAFHEQHEDRALVKGVSFNVRRGEIVGIAGLMGAGRTELAMSLFGRSYGRRVSGKALLRGREIDLGTVGKAVGHGIAYVTEDRKAWGLILDSEVQHNISLANLAGVSRWGVIDEEKEYTVANAFRERMNIRCPDASVRVGTLSGGNQQKTVLAKWLFSGPDILILDEPTRGIDVGAKYEIYCLIADLAREGKSIVLISSEMPELLGISDRIYVMNDGAFVAEMRAAEANQEKIMHAIVRAGRNKHE